MHKYLMGMALLWAAVIARADQPAGHWLEVHSAHFVVLSDANEPQARRIAGQFEEMRSVFRLLLPNATADAGAPILVVALKDKRGFQALEPEAYLAKGQLELAGLFLSAPEKNYILIRLDAEGDHPFATVYHEYTHLMLSKATWLPLWLNEGLAEFYQNTQIDEKDVLLGKASADDLLFLRQNSLLPIETLLKVDSTSPYYHEEQKSSIFYAESWALTHFLEITDRQKNTDRLQDYARLLKQNEDPVTAARHAFGDLTELQHSLESYVQQGTFLMFKMETAVTVDGASFRVQPVSTANANAVRADVLVYNQRYRDAETLLEATLREDPANARAFETMGLLKFREGDVAAAKKWYGEAVRLDSQSYLAHYYYAVMSLQAGDSDRDAGIESSLRTSIKLNPPFAPAYDALAMFYVSRHKRLDEARQLNGKAVQLEPENFSYRINAATVLVEDGQYSGAIGVLKLAKKLARNEDEIALLQSRIEQVEQFRSSAHPTRASTN